jgi:hypothetical protein
MYAKEETGKKENKNFKNKNYNKQNRKSFPLPNFLPFFPFFLPLLPSPILLCHTGFVSLQTPSPLTFFLSGC